MAYLLDTDICSAHLRDVRKVTTRLVQHAGQLSISVLTLGELLSWTLRANSPRKYQLILQSLLNDVAVLEVDSTIANKFGEVRARLLDIGQPIAAIDLMIGATALTHGLTMVTHNIQHFSRIPGLPIDDWLAP